MTEAPASAQENHTIVTCLVIKGDSQESVFAIDSRKLTDPAEFSQAENEAWDEMQRRRVPCEWETRPVLPGEPPSTLPSWAEYRVDLDRKHPLPEDEDNT